MACIRTGVFFLRDMWVAPLAHCRQDVSRARPYLFQIDTS